MYVKCFFCLDQLLKLKKESTASFFVTFWRSRGTKEPAYITVLYNYKYKYKNVFTKKNDDDVFLERCVGRLAATGAPDPNRGSPQPYYLSHDKPGLQRR